MSASDSTEPTTTRPRWAVLRGVILGVLVNVLFWALFGVLLSLVIVPIAWVVAAVTTQRGYMPYNGSAGADILGLAWVLGLFCAPLGLFTGAVIGARFGWRADQTELRFPRVLAAIGEATLNGTLSGLFFLIPMLLLTVWPLWVVYSEEVYSTVEEVAVTRVKTERPIGYYAELWTKEGHKELQVQDSSAEPRVQVGDKLRVVHKGKLWEGHLLLPGQNVPRMELSGKAMFMIGIAVFGFLLFGGLWVFFYLRVYSE